MTASDYQPRLPVVRMSPDGIPYVPVAGVVSGDTGKATVNSWGQIALVNAPVLAETTDGVREQCHALLALCDYLDNPDNQVNAMYLHEAHWRHAAKPVTEDDQ